MLRIQLANPKTGKDNTPQSIADQYAIRYGLLTSLLIAVYNLVLTLLGDGKWELAHLLIFAILFFMIGYGMSKARKWIREGHAMDDRMVFGLVFSIVTALGLIALNAILALLNYHFEISAVFLPISDVGRFAVNSMGLFFGSLIFGFLSTFIFANIYAGK